MSVVPVSAVMAMPIVMRLRRRPTLMLLLRRRLMLRLRRWLMLLLRWRSLLPHLLLLPRLRLRL